MAHFCDYKSQDWQDTPALKKNVHRNLFNINSIEQKQGVSQSVLFFHKTLPLDHMPAYMTSTETSNINSHIPRSHIHFVTVQKLKLPVFYLTI